MAREIFVVEYNAPGQGPDDWRVAGGYSTDPEVSEGYIESYAPSHPEVLYRVRRYVPSEPESEGT